MKRLSFFLLVLSLLTIVSVAYVDGMKLEVREGTIKGRIYEATTRRGIPGLTVRLIPTVAMKKPEKITATPILSKPLIQSLSEERLIKKY